ncbi:MAG: TolC family protein [Burkholderiales bacterium]|nr:TolC family protein [Burkholderiales bacterium]
MVSRCIPARSFRVTSLIVALALSALAAPSVAAEAPLTLAEAQRRALARSQMLPAQDAAAAAAREMAVAAGQLPDPVLKLGIDNVPVNGSDAWSLTQDFMTMGRIGVMQEWINTDKRDTRRARFEREASRAEVEKAAAQANIARDTALAWIDRYYAEALVALIGEQIVEAGLEVDSAEFAYRGGRGSQADVFAARGAKAALTERMSEARRRVATAVTMLARWVGQGADAPLAGSPKFETVPLSRTHLATQLADHPMIAQLTQAQAVAAAEAQVAQANRDPSWSFEIAYQQRSSAYSNMMSVGVSIPLPWDRANRQDRDVAAKLALVDQARALREEALRAHVAEVAAMLDEWDNGRERQALYAESLLPLARDRTAAAVAAYRGGKSALAEVLAARRGELDLRREALLLERETARLWAQLNFLDVTSGTHAALASVAKDTR